MKIKRLRFLTVGEDICKYRKNRSPRIIFEVSDYNERYWQESMVLKHISDRYRNGHGCSSMYMCVYICLCVCVYCVCIIHRCLESSVTEEGGQEQWCSVVMTALTSQTLIYYHPPLRWLRAVGLILSLGQKKCKWIWNISLCKKVRQHSKSDEDTSKNHSKASPTRQIWDNWGIKTVEIIKMQLTEETRKLQTQTGIKINTYMLTYINKRWKRKNSLQKISN